MAQVIKQTEMQSTKSESNTAARFVGTVFGVVEVVLASRLILKLLGANPGNSLVRGLYDVTEGFVGLFAGIFSPVATPGVGNAAILEPATLIAMLVTAMAAWLVMRLITPRVGSGVKSTAVTEYTE